MGEWFAGGRIVDAILALVAVEAAVLVLARRVHGIPLRGLAANLAAGACLLAALRLALSGAGWPWIAAALAAALLAHAGDVAARWRHPGRDAA